MRSAAVQRLAILVGVIACFGAIRVYGRGFGIVWPYTALMWASAILGGYGFYLSREETGGR